MLGCMVSKITEREDWTAKPLSSVNGRTCMLIPFNIACDGCRRPITMFPAWDGGRVRWRAFDRPIPYAEYRHSCPKYPALHAQPVERRVLPTERHARRYEQPARRSTVGWPEERRSPTFLTRHKTELQSLAWAFGAAVAWAIIHWIRHYSVVASRRVCMAAPPLGAIAKVVVILVILAAACFWLLHQEWWYEIAGLLTSE
jgi:hypothetical protein